MKTFDNLIIGFGKGGKTLAAALRAAGQSVALCERSPAMYGGACINVACIPTKALEHSARQSAAQGGAFEARSQRYREAVAQKRTLIATLRQKNLDKALQMGVEVYTGTASFVNDHLVRVALESGQEEDLSAQRIFINTGSYPFLPPISGLLACKRTYTSETLMEQDTLPKRLVIIGGGYIGLEFASCYANFGAQVTILQDGSNFIPREDGEMAAAVLKSLEARGVTVLREAKTTRVEDFQAAAHLYVNTLAGSQRLEADAILVATGRRPNLAGLHLENAGVQLTSRGSVRVDERLRTSVPHIYAMGDVTGGQQFTYLSLDDSRIVKSALLGDGGRTTQNRGQVPYTIFLDPPLSRVGMTQEEAEKAGYAVKVFKLPAAAIPKAQVMHRPVGLLKALVDEKNGLILGAHFFCAESQEMINLIKLAMDAGLPFSQLRDGIYTHPTMSEALNDLFYAV